MDCEDDQIVRARRVHDFIDDRFKRSQRIILREPSGTPKLHKLSFPVQSEEDRKAELELRRWFADRIKMRHGNVLNMDEAIKWDSARKVVEWGFPYFRPESEVDWFFNVSEEQELCEEWTHSPHHDLLMKMLAAGKVPRDVGPSASCHARRLDTARIHATDHGHLMPPESLTKKQRVGYGEEEAFYAAYDLLHSGTIENAYLKQFGSKFRPFEFCSVVSNFPVPIPNQQKGFPYLLDQLWVILVPGPSVRLLAIEVDDEGHQKENRIAHDTKRDRVLSELGYEIWRVADWWCRIDAWRSVVEVIRRAGFLPDAESVLGESCLSDIESYVCDLCGEPMVRYDSHWIRQWSDDDCGDLRKAHECCFPR